MCGLDAISFMLIPVAEVAKWMLVLSGSALKSAVGKPSSAFHGIFSSPLVWGEVLTQQHSPITAMSPGRNMLLTLYCSKVVMLMCSEERRGRKKSEGEGGARVISC